MGVRRISHGDIEDAFVQALALLSNKEGGPFRTLETSGAYPTGEALKRLLTSPQPACLVLAASSKPGKLRAGNHCDWQHTIVLLIGAASFRSRTTAARGDGISSGVYDLLLLTNQALQSRVILDAAGSELHPGTEQLVTSSASAIIWAQEWHQTIYQ